MSNDTSINVTKGVIVAVLKTFFQGFWAVILPLAALIVCEIVDYITGILAARNRKQEVTSLRGYEGIRKKVGMLILVLVGCVVDLMILYCARVMSLELPSICSFMFSCVICLWLICNELISITENVRNMGVPIPIFLMPVLKLLKTKSEQTVAVESGDMKDEQNK